MKKWSQARLRSSADCEEDKRQGMYTWLGLAPSWCIRQSADPLLIGQFAIAVQTRAESFGWWRDRMAIGEEPVRDNDWTRL